MAHPDLEPGHESATPAALGDVFRVVSNWLQEHGTVSLGQVLDPVYSDDQAPSYDFDGQVICNLLPRAAAVLAISSTEKLSCGFWPAYLDGSEVEPPECGFSIDKRDPLIEEVVFTLILAEMDTDDWLATGKKEVDYRPTGETPHEGSARERYRKSIEAFALERSIPPDPISPAECDALQAIADNLDLLKYHQDRRGA